MRFFKAHVKWIKVLKTTCIRAFKGKVEGKSLHVNVKTYSGFYLKKANALKLPYVVILIQASIMIGHL